MYGNRHFLIIQHEFCLKKKKKKMVIVIVKYGYLVVHRIVYFSKLLRRTVKVQLFEYFT